VKLSLHGTGARMEKPKQETDQRKQRIVNAAIEVIREKGVKDTSTRDIAKRAGLTTGAIYHHYKNREALLYDVLHQSLHISHKITNNPETKTKKRKEVLEEVCNGVADRFSKTDDQRLYILLLSEIIAQNNDLTRQYAEFYKKILDETGDLFKYAFGIENAGIKKEVASLLVMALDGFAIQQSLGALPQKNEKMIRIFIEFFSESIPAYLKKHL